jgi:hypothetical protein
MESNTISKHCDVFFNWSKADSLMIDNYKNYLTSLLKQYAYMMRSLCLTDKCTDNNHHSHLIITWGQIQKRY